jgi:hypothetical protein
LERVYSDTSENNELFFVQIHSNNQDLKILLLGFLFNLGIYALAQVIQASP